MATDAILFGLGLLSDGRRIFSASAWFYVQGREVGKVELWTARANSSGLS